MFIAIEGIDGSGKTTLASEVSKRLKYHTLQSIPKHMRPFKKVVDRFATPYLHYLFYASAMRSTSHTARRYLKENRGIVADRYWYSTVATHKALGVNASARHFVGTCEPDLVVYVTTDDTVRKKRMRERGLDPNDKRMLHLDDAVKKEFKSLLPHGKTLYLDSTHSTPQMLADAIVTKFNTHE